MIEEIRRAVDGQVYATLADKIAAIDAVLTELDADPAHVRRLTGWDWIDQAFDHLPAASPPIVA